MSEIQISGKFASIPPENIEQFKALAADCVTAVREKDTGTRQYEWSFSADERTCVVRETYDSSEAMLEHMANVGHLLAPLFELGGGLDVDVFGEPSAELLTAAAGFNPKVYSTLVSL